MKNFLKVTVGLLIALIMAAVIYQINILYIEKNAKTRDFRLISEQSAVDNSVQSILLEGLDYDNDGVRDDVQIALDNLYPLDTEVVKFALMQMARAIQIGFVAQDVDDEDMLNDSVLKIVEAAKCINSVSEFPDADISLIENLMANTKDRGDAFLEIQFASTGIFFDTDVSSNYSHCSFASD